MRNDFEEEDEDQVGMMDRIEDEFNYYHRSHIYVTGTISVVVSKPHTDTQMFNPNYHANIKAILKKKEDEKKIYNHNPNLAIGRKVTYKYQNDTKNDLPRFATVKCFRDDD